MCHGRHKLVLLIAISLLFVSTLSIGCGDNGTSDSKKTGRKTAAALTWPARYRDNRRTGRGVTSGPEAVQVKWTYETGAGSHSWATLDKKGNVLVGVRSKVVAVSPGGTLAWEYASGAAATSCTVGDDGTIYVGNGSSLVALSSGGTLKWTYEIGSEVDEPSVGSDGTVYAGSQGGKLVALTGDGKLKWEKNVGGPVRSPSIDKSGSLYCGAASLALYAFDRNGKQKWAFKPEGDLPVYEGLLAWANTFDVPSVGDDGTIYAGSFPYPNFTTSGQQIPDYAIPQTGKLYAVTAAGQKKWEYALGEGTGNTIKSPTIGKDGTLYCGTACWKVLAIDPTGKLKWTFDTNEGKNECPTVWSPPIGTDGLLYAATSNARIFCITPEGAEKWRFTGGEPWLPDHNSNGFTPPPVGEDGTLYSFLAQGKVFAFNPTGKSK